MAKGKDLEAFRNAHDKSHMVPKRIKAGLAALGDSWEYEGELIKRCELSQVDFSKYRDEFKAFWFEVPGTARGTTRRRVWAGTAKFAAQLRAKLEG